MQAGGFGWDVATDCYSFLYVSYTCSRYMWRSLQESFICIFDCCDVTVVPLQLFFTLKTAFVQAQSEASQECRCGLLGSVTPENEGNKFLKPVRKYIPAKCLLVRTGWLSAWYGWLSMTFQFFIGDICGTIQIFPPQHTRAEAEISWPH